MITDRTVSPSVGPENLLWHLLWQLLGNCILTRFRACRDRLFPVFDRVNEIKRFSQDSTRCQSPKTLPLIYVNYVMYIHTHQTTTIKIHLDGRLDKTFSRKVHKNGWAKILLLSRIKRVFQNPTFVANFCPMDHSLEKYTKRVCQNPTFIANKKGVPKSYFYRE